MSAKEERFKPKRREQDPVRRTPKGQCVGCQYFEPMDGNICLWKLEAQIDKASQHMNIALSLIRKVTAQQRLLVRKLELETPSIDIKSIEAKQEKELKAKK